MAFALPERLPISKHEPSEVSFVRASVVVLEEKRTLQSHVYERIREAMLVTINASSF
jgi:hypothetical protein